MKRMQVARKSDKLTNVVLLGAAALLLYIGWREFWFITDDAYIAFRYVSNSIHGLGYVWNPAPFQAVEGYTSFLWVVILETVWRVFGAEPPKAANTISLIFSFGTIIVTAIAAMKMKLTPQLERLRHTLVVLVVGGLLINPAFHTWASSGLETALFNFCLLCWVVSVILIQEKGHWWRLAVTGTAALTYLARPDGVLMVGGTAVLVALSFIDDTRQRKISLKWCGTILPLLIPVVHLIWRRSFYGEWLPNTYYAKQVAAWPEAGIRYFLSFLIEYGVWFWIIVIAVALVKLFKELRRGGNWHGIGPLSHNNNRVCVGIAVTVVIVHWGYYTFIVGGDHFEWRVYSQLFPLLSLSFLFALRALNLSATKAVMAVILMIALSLPIPWTYHMTERRITYVPLANTLKLTAGDKIPFLVSPLAEVQDSLQSWLTDHLICIRRQKHKLFFENQVRVYPERTFDVPPQVGRFPVANLSTVGVPGWTLPNIAIIDGYGLNDYIVARTPVVQGKERRMAHDRLAPEHYLATFVPNVRLTGVKSIDYSARPPELELTADKIKAIEQYWEDKIVRKMNIPDSVAPWPISINADSLARHNNEITP